MLLNNRIVYFCEDKQLAKILATNLFLACDSLGLTVSHYLCERLDDLPSDAGWAVVVLDGGYGKAIAKQLLTYGSVKVIMLSDDCQNHVTAYGQDVKCSLGTSIPKSKEDYMKIARHITGTKGTGGGNFNE